MAELILRPYQQDLITRTHTSMANGKQRPLIVLPTGGGKTAVFAWMANRAQSKGSIVWFLVHRRELLDQTIDTFRKFDIPTDSVMIGMVGSVVNRIGQYERPDLIVMDEAHHSPARTWQRIIDAYPETHVIGLTATPCRLDGKPLGAIYDDLIEGPTTPELIQQGYLSKYRYIASEISIGALGIKRGDYDQEQAAEKLMTRAVYGNVIDTYRRYAEGMQAIYFCTTIKHSQAMAEEFDAASIRAEHFDGKTKKRDRTEIIKRFRAGETQVLCNVALISEGFDMPGCDVVGMLRPTQSLNVYLQQVGRALRPRDGKTAVLIDHVGNLNRHGTPSDPRAWSLDAPVKAERAVNKDGSYQIRRCEDCQGVYESTSSECPYCGAEYTPTQDEIRTMEHIKMVEIQILQEQKARVDAWKPEAITDAKSYSDLCKIAKLRGYKTGWAYHQAKQKGMWVPY